MKILNVNSIILNKPVFKKQEKGYEYNPNSSRTFYIENDSFEHSDKILDEDFQANKGVAYSSINGIRKCICEDKNNRRISLEKDKMNAVIELEEQDGKDYKSTVFGVTREHGGKSYCKYKEGKGSKAKKMYLRWSYPEMNYTYSGSTENLAAFKASLCGLRNLIFSENFLKDFGNTRSFNFQLKGAINYLQGQIDAYKEAE